MIKVRSLTSIALSMAAVSFASHTHAQHWGDLAGDAPTADITGDKLILNNSTTGRQVELTLSANAIDIDQHLNSCGGHDPVLDPIAQYQWVVPANITLQAPVNLTGATVTFTTANAAGVNGDVEIKIKDAGDHFQDLANVTLVDTQNIKLVDPDDLTATPTNPSGSVETFHQNNDPSQPITAHYLSVDVVFQCRYQNTDLPWVGRIQEKIINDLSKFNFYVNNATKQGAAVPASVDLLATFTTNQDGKFTDNKNLPYFPVTFGNPPTPNAGSYHVIVHPQDHVNVEDNNSVLGPTFGVHLWIDNNLNGGAVITR